MIKNIVVHSSKIVENGYNFGTLFGEASKKGMLCIGIYRSVPAAVA